MNSAPTPASALFTEGALWRIQLASAGQVGIRRSAPQKSLVNALRTAENRTESRTLVLEHGVMIVRGSVPEYVSQPVLADKRLLEVLHAFTIEILDTMLERMVARDGDEIVKVTVAKAFSHDHPNGMTRHEWREAFGGEGKISRMPASTRKLMMSLEHVVSTNHLLCAQTAYGLWGAHPELFIAEPEGGEEFEDYWFDTAESCLRREVLKRVAL